MRLQKDLWVSNELIFKWYSKSNKNIWYIVDVNSVICSRNFFSFTRIYSSHSFYRIQHLSAWKWTETFEYLSLLIASHLFLIIFTLSLYPACSFVALVKQYSILNIVSIVQPLESLDFIIINHYGICWVLTRRTILGVIVIYILLLLSQYTGCCHNCDKRVKEESIYIELKCNWI